MFQTKICKTKKKMAQTVSATSPVFSIFVQLYFLVFVSCQRAFKHYIKIYHIKYHTKLVLNI
jgi:hypothetical protein